MSARVLLTGGRTAIALELARALHRAGHTVFVADTFPRYVAMYSNCVERAFVVPAPRLEPDAFLEQLGEIVRRHGITHLIPTGEEVLWVARGRARLAEDCDVFCDRVETLDALHDKLQFSRLAAALGATPRTWPLESAAQVAGLRARHGPVILKKIYSRFGRDVLIPDRAVELPPGEWLVQEFIAGREICGFAIARLGTVRAQVSYLPQYRIPLGPSFLFEPVAHRGVEAWIRAFVARHSFTGGIGFDFIESGDGTLYPIECNPRMTSGAHLLRGSLAPALLNEGEAAEVRPHSAMWGVAMLGIALPQVRSLAALRQWVRAFAASRDVFWDTRDPRPAMHIPSSRRQLRKVARKHGLSLRDATTFYTSWDRGLTCEMSRGTR